MNRVIWGAIFSAINSENVLISVDTTFRQSFSISGNQKPETRNQKPETRNQKPETRNQKPETRNQKPETRNQKPETKNLAQGDPWIA
jgi:hypothetical protein